MTKPVEEAIDVEAYAKEGRPVPAAASYRIRIDKDHHTVHSPKITGRELLELAKKDPAKFGIYEHVRGRSSRVAVDAVVDLTSPGVERFSTLPLDQTEGEA
jgi:hypothetical protein